MSTTTIGNRLDKYQITRTAGPGCWRHPRYVTAGCYHCVNSVLLQRVNHQPARETLHRLCALDLVAEEYATGLDR